MLERVTERFDVEMSGGTKKYMVSAKQADRATRYVEVTLLNGGEQYTIPAASTVTAYIRKPDKKRVYTACTYTGATVTVELNSQALAAAGTALCEVEVKSSDLTQVITSVTFEIEIEPRVKDDDAIASADEMSVLDTTLKAYAEAEAKRVTAENARVKAESGRAEAEKGRVSAEGARVTAEKSRQQQAQEVLDKANKAVEIASQINEASYILDADDNVKYAFSIYAQRSVPYMALTRINE